MPLLQTKLHMPYEQTNRLIIRPRLHNLLSQGLACKLTLVAAPAGFGKTALVCNWLREERRVAAWVSLEESDSDLTQFLRYVVASLHRAYPQIGRELFQVVEEAALDNPEPFLSELIHEIEQIPSEQAAQKYILVLDDYHLIATESVHGALRFLLEHLPRSLHLILTTRADPPLPLARMRVRQALNEIRADALRFSPDELEAFFRQLNAIPLSPQQLEQLSSRTEGWIAGMQLASLTLQGLDATQAEQFITALAGTDRYISDYLLDEVLLRQPDEVRSFLLQTSILERLSPGLCDAVTNQKNGRELLRQLEAGNFFLIPLDHAQQWYRYHHLFLDLLRAQLHYQHPDAVVDLHRRACDWYAANERIADALHHAFAAEDFERAANLIELSWRSMDRSFQSATWLSWAKRLPDALVRNRPVLSMGYGWALLDTGQFESAEPRLQDAERWLTTTAETDVRSPKSQSQTQSGEVDGTGMVAVDMVAVDMVVVAEDVFQSLPATIAAARAYLAYALGDLPSTQEAAQRALDLLPDDDPFYRGIPAVTLGLAYWASGDLEAAYRSFAEAIVDFQRADNHLFAISGIHVMAEILVAQGRLREALSIYARAFRLAEEQSTPMSLVKANLHRGISEIHREQGDLQVADQHLSTSKQLHERAMRPHLGFRFWVAQARVKESEGELDEALALLNEAERVYSRDRLPNVRPIAALKTRVWIRQGRLTEALGWARERGVSVDDQLSYLKEFEHITLARALIQQHANTREDAPIHQAIDLLERLLEEAKAGARTGSTLEILLLLALSFEQQGASDRALDLLRAALTLGKPEGFVRTFVDEGEAVVPILRRLASAGIEPEYVTSLLNVLQSELPAMELEQPLVEPLSPRELELLQLVSGGLSNQQISEELTISIATTKKHMSNILGKLAASNRTEAVRRARDLNLL